MLSRLVIFLCLFASCVLAQQSNAALMQRYSQEGEKALAAGRYDEAAQAYEKLHELSPATAEIQARLGLIYFQQGKFEQAVPLLRQAIKLKPTLPNTDVLLAMTLSELGQYQEALPALEKGFKRATDPALKRSSGLQLQRAYTGLGQDDKAVEVALELTRVYPKDPEVLYHAGRLFANYAYLATVKLSQVAPASVWMRQARGETYESQGYHDLAIKEYREVLTLDPNRPGIHFRIGRALLSRSQQEGSSEEAAREFAQELKLDPTNANAAYELAEIHRKAGAFDKSQPLFELALKYYPDFQEAQVGLGRVLNTQGKPDQALTYLRKAVALNPRDEVAHYQLSQVYKALGNTTEQQKALAEFQRIRDGKLRQQEEATLAPRQVTRQQLDPKVVQ